MAKPQAHPAGRGSRPAAPRTSVRRRLVFARAVLLAGAGITVLWLAFRPRPSPPADPLSALDPGRAWERALELSQAGRYIESVPFFQRVLAASGPVPLPVRNAYTAALHNAVLHARRVERFGRPTTRSSIERVQLTNLWLRHLDELEADAGSASRRAFLVEVRSSTLAMWGFSRDARAEHLRARALDPTVPEAPPEGP